MRYAMLIYTSEAANATMSQEEQGAIMAAYGAFTNEITEKGINLGGEALQSTGTAKTVHLENGQTVATDGPFAETKEQLGGFYLMECKDMDEAISYAAKIPAAQNGRVEVRPIMEFG
ncbi:MAG: YciI family protein [Chloroflexota bacterium]